MTKVAALEKRMLSLGRFLEDTLASKMPEEAIQTTPDGVRLRWIQEGVLEVTPADGWDDGLDLIVSAGIHGNETAPVELLDRLVKAIARGQLNPQARLLFILGNPMALRQGVRFIKYDINRLFCGRHSLIEGPEAIRASELERLAKVFFAEPSRERLHYDLHTAIRGSKIEQFALYPWCEGREHSRAEIDRLAKAGMQAVLLQSKAGITFSSYTYSQLGAEAFTLELGKARPFGQNIEIDISSLERMLECLVQGREREFRSAAKDIQLFRVAREILKETDHFKMHLDENIDNFTKLEQGSLIAVDSGGLMWSVEEEDARIIFPNPRVAKGLRAGIIVVPASDIR